jgi:hypothetical protein
MVGDKFKSLASSLLLDLGERGDIRLSVMPLHALAHALAHSARAYSLSLSLRVQLGYLGKNAAASLAAGLSGEHASGCPGPAALSLRMLAYPASLFQLLRTFLPHVSFSVYHSAAMSHRMDRAFCDFIQMRSSLCFGHELAESAESHGQQEGSWVVSVGGNRPLSARWTAAGLTPHHPVSS